MPFWTASKLLAFRLAATRAPASTDGNIGTWGGCRRVYFADPDAYFYEIIAADEAVSKAIGTYLQSGSEVLECSGGGVWTRKAEREGPEMAPWRPHESGPGTT